MQRSWFGDSYDIVKRFFCGVLREMGFAVRVEPMFTGDWSGDEERFFRFVSSGDEDPRQPNPAAPTAVLVDPDTGIGSRRGPGHCTIDDVAAHARGHDLVLVFDQAFSRAGSARSKMETKLETLRQCGAVGFYYDSHARFMFASRSRETLKRVRTGLLRTGLPEERLLGWPAFG